MEHAVTHSLVVPGHVRSFGDDNWRTTESAYVDAWKAAVDLLKERQVSVNGITYSVKIDWTPLLRRYERHYSAMAYIDRRKDKDLSASVALAKFPRRASRIRVVTQSNSKEGKNFESVVESVLYDVFLIMNIAAPGCCNFYRAKLIGDQRTTEVSLSGGEFELCILPSRRRRQTAGFVPVGRVVEWYQSVRPSAGQLPANSTERAMFALLHRAKLNDEMLAVVWLFYAFESLLQTKVGENFSSIVRRLVLVLGATIKDIPAMKKEMRALYDLRSAIVHGGFEAIHPMQDEILDNRVDKVFGQLLHANEYGLVLLLAAIQKMAEANWRELRFDEIIVEDQSVRQ